MKKFTKVELSKYNGKNGMPIFVAYQGKVYDVSSSFLWEKGKHQVLHKAGLDQTEDLKLAPHGAEMFEKFPLVGILEHSYKRRIWSD